MSVSIICCLAVPLFWMISGALLLASQTIYLRALIKKIFKYVVVLILVSLVYYIYRDSNYPVKTTKEYLKLLYSSRVEGHLWFMYAYIMMLISVPFLCPLVHGLQDKGFKYLLLLAFIFKSIIPIFKLLVLNNSMELNALIVPSWITADAIICPIIGYYLDCKLDIRRLRLKAFLGMWILCIFILAINSIIVYEGCWLAQDWNLRVGGKAIFLEFFQWFYAIIMFLTIKRISFEPRTNNSIANRLGGCVLAFI